MGTPYDRLPKLNSLSRWNDLSAYNRLQRALQESPRRGPFLGQQHARDGSPQRLRYFSTDDSDRRVYQQRQVDIEAQLHEGPNFVLSAVNKRNPSPDQKIREYVWNSSIDHHHTYRPCSTYGDPYDPNEYQSYYSNLNVNPISCEEPISLHDDNHSSITHLAQQELAGSYATSFSPVSESSTYFSPERATTDERRSNSQHEYITKDHKERPKRQKNKLESDEGICGVCGDNAKSLHFGGMACDSCKAFFRRSVQTKSCHSFKCSTSQNCQINRQSRKNCQYCRFQKCLRIGMEIRWVMPESERMELWKAKLARHREVKSITQTVTSYSPVTQIATTAVPILSSKDTTAIKDLTILQEVIFSSASYPPVCNNSEDLSNIFFCICQKLQKFFFRIEEFQEICPEDQSLLMKGGISTSIYIHGAYLYDVEQDAWPSTKNKPYLKVPTITNQLLREFTVFKEIYDALMTFYRKYGCDIKEEAILALLCTIALFFEPPPNVKCIDDVLHHRNYFVQLLKRYLIDKLGSSAGEEKCAHLMGCYVHTKKIVSFHNKVAIEPNLKLQKVTQWNVSFAAQMNNLIDGLRQSRMAGLPQFSSVLGPSKPNDKRLRKVDKKATYAWLTSVIFGNETKSDTLLSLFHPEILIQKRPSGLVTQEKDIGQLP